MNEMSSVRDASQLISAGITEMGGGSLTATDRVFVCHVTGSLLPEAISTKEVFMAS